MTPPKSTRWQMYSQITGWISDPPGLRRWWVFDSEDSGDHPNDSVHYSAEAAGARALYLNLVDDFDKEMEEKHEEMLAVWLAEQGYTEDDLPGRNYRYGR